MHFHPLLQIAVDTGQFNAVTHLTCHFWFCCCCWNGQIQWQKPSTNCWRPIFPSFSSANPSPWKIYSTCHFPCCLSSWGISPKAFPRSFLFVFFSHATWFVGLPGSSLGKESACNTGDLSSIPGSGRCPRERNGYPFQDSCPENSVDRGAWHATVMKFQRAGHNWATNTFMVCRILVFDQGLNLGHGTESIKS